MPRLVLTLLALALLPPFVTGSTGEPFAPSRVVVVSDGSVAAVVDWLPGPETADGYRVYGFNPDGTVLLVDTAESAAGPLTLAVTVPAGYSGYAVSGVRAGVESSWVFPVGIEHGCVRVETDPPGVGIDNWCTRAVVKVRRL